MLLIFTTGINDVRQDEKIIGVRVKKKGHKLRTFADNLVLIDENPLERLDILMEKLKEFSIDGKIASIIGRISMIKMNHLE